MIIFAGSGLAARWPCRTGIVTRSEACRASRRRPELGGVAAKAAASLAASFPSRTPVSGPQRHCPRSTTGAREGEPQASRCRSRVSVPSVDPNVTAPGLRPGAREGEPQASRCRSRVRVSVSGPQRHCPRSTTGGPGGRAARRVDAVPASAFRQWTPTSLPPVYDRGRGRASRRLWAASGRSGGTGRWSVPGWITQPLPSTRKPGNVFFTGTACSGPPGIVCWLSMRRISMIKPNSTCLPRCRRSRGAFQLGAPLACGPECEAAVAGALSDARHRPLRRSPRPGTVCVGGGRLRRGQSLPLYHRDVHCSRRRRKPSGARE